MLVEVINAILEVIRCTRNVPRHQLLWWKCIAEGKRQIILDHAVDFVIIITLPHHKLQYKIWHFWSHNGVSTYLGFPSKMPSLACQACPPFPAKDTAGALKGQVLCP